MALYKCIIIIIIIINILWPGWTLLVGSLFGQTCLACLNPPLLTVQGVPIITYQAVSG